MPYYFWKYERPRHWVHFDIFFLVDRTTLVILFQWIKTFHQYFKGVKRSKVSCVCLGTAFEACRPTSYSIIFHPFLDHDGLLLDPIVYLVEHLSWACMIFALQEEVRSKLSALEACHQNEIQRTISAFARLQKYAESRKEIDRRLDVHFQRRMYVLHCNFVSLRMPKKNYICFTEQHLRLSISSTILSICIRSKLHSSRLSFC
jgi:hypothetical protein